MCEVFFFLWLGVPLYLIVLGWLFSIMPGEALAFAVLMLFSVCAAVIIIILAVVAFYVFCLLLGCCFACVVPPPEERSQRTTTHPYK